ncbi:hypothetical protein KDK77_09635, partial [bacterium]|nr:hypothetical protein [bacterium]
IRYNQLGQPFANLSGRQTVTKFRNGQPVEVVNRGQQQVAIDPRSGLPIRQKDGSLAGEAVRYESERVFSLSYMQGDPQIGGFSLVRNNEGDATRLDLLSRAEKWIGPLSQGEMINDEIVGRDEVYVLSKNGTPVALIKARDEKDTVIPLVSSIELIRVLGVESHEEAMQELNTMAENRRVKVREIELKYAERQTAYEQQSREPGRTARVTLASMAGLMLLQTLSGCATSMGPRPDLPVGDVSYQPPVVPDDGSPVTDISRYTGVTDTQPSFPQAILFDAQQGGLDLLNKALTAAENELAGLEKHGVVNSDRAKILKDRIGVLRDRIASLSSLPTTQIPQMEPDTRRTSQQSGQYVDRQVDRTGVVQGQPDIVFPPQLASELQNILSAQEYKTLMADIVKFSVNQTIDAGSPAFTGDKKFDGWVRSYDGDESDKDYPFLAKPGRVFGYDQSLSVYADIANKDYAKAKRKVDALFRIMEYERGRGLDSVIRFSYNTDGTGYEAALSPMGNTSWVLKSIFAYMDVTNDRSYLSGRNGELLLASMRYVLDKQVLDRADVRYGLFQGGSKPTIVDGKIQSIPMEVVFSEHNADVHDLLNLAYRVTGMQIYKDRRLLLDQQMLRTLFVDDARGTYFKPNLDRSGETKQGIAIDNLTWGGSMVLTMDHLPLATRLDITRKLINHIRNNFAVEHVPGQQEAKPVALTPSFVAQRIAKPSNAVVGLKFFDEVFRDDFLTQPIDWDSPNIMSVQFEATIGYIHLLIQTAYLTSDSSERAQLINEAKFLFSNIQKFHAGNSKKGGISYSTRPITGIQTSLESLVASETLRTLTGIWSNPDLLWTFIGASSQSLQGDKTVQPIDPNLNPINAVILGTDAKPDILSQSLQGRVPEKVTPAGTVVIDARTQTAIHAESQYGTVAVGTAEDTSVSRVFREDFAWVVDFLRGLGEKPDLSPQQVQKWNNTILNPISWQADISAIAPLKRLAQNTQYSATIEKGKLRILVEHPIAAAQFRGVEFKNAGDRFEITIIGNEVRVKATLNAAEYERYKDMSDVTQRIYRDLSAPAVFKLSDFPSLAGYADQSGKPVVIQARLDASRQN